VVAGEDDVCDLSGFEGDDDPQHAGQVHCAQMAEQAAAEPAGQRSAAPRGEVSFELVIGAA
jgi:hypothetical protein